jgi:hypothetical protein
MQYSLTVSSTIAVGTPCGFASEKKRSLLENLTDSKDDSSVWLVILYSGLIGLFVGL